MHRPAALPAAVLAALLLAPAARAQASFQGLGGGVFRVAYAVSADGAYVAGTGSPSGPEGYQAYRWSAATGTVALGDLPGGVTESIAWGVSNAGVAVGTGYSDNPRELAVRWAPGAGPQALPNLPGPEPNGYAGAISADGSVVVGFSKDTSYTRQPVRWVNGGGPQVLGPLPAGFSGGLAYGITPDGAVIVGELQGPDGSAPFRWTAGGGMQVLGAPPGGSTLGAAHAVSDDGGVVVGYVQLASSGEQVAFRWTAATGLVLLGDLAGGPVHSQAEGVSGDGATVVGWGYAGGARTAFIWTEADGMRRLDVVLTTEYGLDLTGWWLTEATALSSDGTVIVGGGTNPQGQAEAWRVGLPGQCEERSRRPIRTWADPAGGPFAEASNWIGGDVPGAADGALFPLAEGADYPVTFAAAHTNDGAHLRGGNHVRFALGGQTYTLTAASGCRPALTVEGFADIVGAPLTPRLEVEGGAVVALGGTEVRGPAGTELHVVAGGLLDARGGLRLATEAGGRGDALVAAGGRLAAAGALLGAAGDALLVVEDGGEATLAGVVHLGEEVGARGGLRALGATARLHLPGTTAVGYAGAGTLRVGSDALATAGALALGRLTTGDGSAFVEGDALLEATTMDIGVEGDGYASVREGGALLVVGALNVPGGGGEGAVYVQGAGSLVRAGVMRLGRLGRGRLSVAPGSLVEVGTFVLGAQGDSVLAGGCLRIGGGACEGAALGGGAGTLAADTVWVSAGAALDSVAVALGPGGVLGGAGALAFDLANAGALAPGDSAAVGTLTLGGAYTQAAGGALEIELGGPAEGAYDRLAVAGPAALGGVLRFSFINGFVPAPGEAFTVLTAGGVTGGFATVEGPPGSSFSLAYGPSAVTATVLTVDEEPGPGAPAALALHAPSPNPATGRTALRYALPAAGRVRLALYDALGREVAVVVDAERAAGAHEAALDAARLAPGLYVLRLTAGTATVARRLTVAR